MNKEDLDTFMDQARRANTNEEKLTVLCTWTPHMARCLQSTNIRVKDLEVNQAEGCKALHESIAEIKRDITALHSSPKWKDDRLGWLKDNWTWVMLMLIFIQTSFGVNVSGVLQHILDLFK